MFRLALPLAALLAACSPSAPPAEYVIAVGPGKQVTLTLSALEQTHDWQNEPGERLNGAWDDGVELVLLRNSRPDAISAINAASFECEYGEAHADYPDPMAVCTRSFATRDCQMDWEISSTADKGMVDAVDGSFRRDCIGTDRDWPDKIESPIDDQLAPPSLPPT